MPSKTCLYSEAVRCTLCDDTQVPFKKSFVHGAHFGMVLVFAGIHVNAMFLRCESGPVDKMQNFFLGLLMHHDIAAQCICRPAASK